MNCTYNGWEVGGGGRLGWWGQGDGAGVVWCVTIYLVDGPGKAAR